MDCTGLGSRLGQIECCISYLAGQASGTSYYVFDDQTADLSIDKAMPVAGIDQFGKYQFLEMLDGKLRVAAELVAPGAADIPVFSVSGVVDISASNETTILSYTVPSGKKLALNRVFVSGSNIATYEIKNGSSLIARARTYFSGGLNESLEFSGSVILTAGQTINVTVVHERPMLGDFDSYLVGSLSNL